MTLMDLKNDGPIKKILSKTGAQNMAFIADIDRNDFFFCSCGYTYKERYGKNPTYLTKEDALEEEKELVEDGYIRYCPNCKTRYVFYVNDFGEDSFPVKFEPIVKRDDDDFFVFTINEIGIEISEMQINYVEEESDIFIFYDKKHKFFGIVEDFDDLQMNIDNVSSYQKDIDKEYKIPVCFEDGTKYCLDSSRMMFWNLKFDWDASMEFGALKKSNIKEIRDLLAEKTGAFVSDDDFYSLMSLITEYFKKINIPFYKDVYEHSHEYDIRRFCVNNVCSYDSILKYFLFFREMNIDFSKDTLQDAFGIGPEKLQMCKSAQDFFALKKFEKAIKEEKIEEYVNHIFDSLDAELSLYEIDKIMFIAEKTKESIEIVLKHIFRFANSKAQAHKIISNDIEILNSDYSHILDVRYTYSDCMYKKYLTLSGNILTESQFDILMRKPTIDTFCKLVG